MVVELFLETTMQIKVIGALTEGPEFAIGVRTSQGFQMPWQAAGVNLPTDFAWFKKKTKPEKEGEVCALAMGWNTWVSLNQRPLPGRRHYVITRTPSKWNHSAENMNAAFALPDLASVIDAAQMTEVDKLFVIGGPTLWLEAVPMADEVLLTIVHHHFEYDGETIYCKEILDEVTQLFPPPEIFPEVEKTSLGPIDLEFFVWKRGG